MVCHRKATGDSKGQRPRVDWTSESFSASSLGPSGRCVYFSLRVSFILLSFRTLGHRACLWSHFGHSPTQFNRRNPNPHSPGGRIWWAQLGSGVPHWSNWLSQRRACGGEGGRRSSPGQNRCPPSRWPPCCIGKPKALRSNHPAHDEPRMKLLSWVLSQADLGATLGPNM